MVPVCRIFDSVSGAGSKTGFTGAGDPGTGANAEPPPHATPATSTPMLALSTRTDTRCMTLSFAPRIHAEYASQEGTDATASSPVLSRANLLSSKHRFASSHDM